jgi:hypothetical protein
MSPSVATVPDGKSVGLKVLGILFRLVSVGTYLN